MIQPYNKGKDKKIMIWAYFREDRQKSNLVFMPGDPNSKRGGATSAIYIEILEK